MHASRVIGYTRRGRPVFLIAGGRATVDELRAEQQKLVDDGKALVAKIQARGDGPTDEERSTLTGWADRTEEITSEIAEVGRDSRLMSAFDGPADDLAKARAARRPVLYPGNPENPEEFGEHQNRLREQAGRTPGEIFTGIGGVGGDAYRAFLKVYRDGGPSENSRGGPISARSDAEVVTTMSGMLGLQTRTAKLVQARLGMRGLWTPQGEGGSRAVLINSNDTVAGELVRPDYLGLIDNVLLRPLTIRQLVTVMPISTDSYEYVQEQSRTNAAAPVEEATALTGSSGSKPQGDVKFEKQSGSVVTIAEWVAVTRRIVRDAPQLMEYINQYLTDDIALALEDEIVSGDGTGEHLSGILNEVTQEVGPVDATHNMLDLIRQAKRTVRVSGRTNATAVVVNPEDSEAIDILKAHNAGDTAGSYSYYGPGPYGVDTPQPIWGLTRVESEAVDPGTAIVGDFRRAILFDREETNFLVGTANDDLIRNLMRVVAEGRWGFGVIRPSAFCIVSFSS